MVRWCESCRKKRATQRHHRFSQTNDNIRLYGKGNPFDGIDWINDKRNIQYACADCNSSHNGQGRGLITWNEYEFCRAMRIMPRSKTAQAKISQGKIERWW